MSWPLSGYAMSWHLTGNSYTFGSGTSTAAPQVSGIASLLLGYAQDNLGITLYNDDIEQIIRLGVDDKGPTGWDIEYGTGRVNARRALNFVNSPYSVNHWTDNGGGVFLDSDWYTQRFYEVPGLQTGWYWARRYRVEKGVTFPTQFAAAPRVWGRGVETVGFGIDPEFGLGWCDLVPGTVTTSGATLRTYVYELREICMGDPEDCDLVGWFPGYANEVVHAYTALGIQTIPPPNNLQITPSGLNPLLTWDAVIIDENDLDGYHVYRKVGSEPWTRLTTNPQNGISYLDQTIAFSNKFRGVWIQYHITTVVGGVESDPSQNRGMWGDPLWRTAAQTTPLPEEFALHANVPNPFNPSTSIQYDLPEDSRVTLVIYDLLGREVKSLVLGEVPAGYQIIRWNGTDATEKSVASGVYIYRFEVVSLESEQRFSQSRKLLLLR